MGKNKELLSCADLVIIGGGGHGRVCAEVAQAAGWRLKGFCDNVVGIGERINGIEVLGSSLSQIVAIAQPNSTAVFIAIGDNCSRKLLFEDALSFGYKVATLVHPSAVVSPSAEVREGSVLMAGTIVNANARIARYCIVNTAASLDHDVILHDGVQICPGVRLAGRVIVGSQAFLGTGATVIPGVKIGIGAIVGAGSLVLHDVPNESRVAGVPAKPLRKKATKPL